MRLYPWYKKIKCGPEEEAILADLSGSKKDRNDCADVTRIVLRAYYTDTMRLSYGLAT